MIAKTSEDGVLIVVADPEEAAERAAAMIADALVEGVAARGRADWATTGGSAAPGIYRRLAAAPHQERIPWDRVHVWWGDDRYVGPDDPRSNVAPLLEHLIAAGVPLPRANIHPFRGLPAGEPDPGIDQAAASTAAELRGSGLEERDGFPVLDIVLLGMGSDGHILSVFPGSPLFASPAGTLALGIPAPTHIEPRVERVTLHPGILAAARLVVPVVTGTGKAEILADILGEIRDPDRWPAQIARLPHSRWIVDAAAAAGKVLAGPERSVTSADGTRIAVFVSGPVEAPPLILVHGAAADHTTFRVIGPMLAERFHVSAIDRRGRGASGDAGDYAIEREFEDLAAVAEDRAAVAGRPVDVVGHSFGGRVALGAALLTPSIGRIVCYEGAPSPPGTAYGDAATEVALGDLLASGDHDGALALFMTAVVGMSATDLAAYRADPIWPRRAAAVPTLLREYRGEGAPAASLDTLAAVSNPVLQILGSASPRTFREATFAFDRRLSNGRIVVIPDARHAAHHTHPADLVAALADFLVG